MDAAVAKKALERVCSGQGEPASACYSTSFVDHVNGREFRGLAGVEASVDTYRRTIKDLSIRVEQQVVESNLVTCRFVVSGTVYGKPVQFEGITISRFENGLIVEDWSVTDTASMLRQIGIVRSFLVFIRTALSR